MRTFTVYFSLMTNNPLQYLYWEVSIRCLGCSLIGYKEDVRFSCIPVNPRRTSTAWAGHMTPRRRRIGPGGSAHWVPPEPWSVPTRHRASGPFLSLEKKTKIFLNKTSSQLLVEALCFFSRTYTEFSDQIKSTFTHCSHVILRYYAVGIAWTEQAELKWGRMCTIISHIDYDWKEFWKWNSGSYI